MALAVAAFLALTVFAVPFPVVVLGAGLLGWALSRWVPTLREIAAHPGGRRARAADQRPGPAPEPPVRSPDAAFSRSASPLWFAPIVAVAAPGRLDHVFLDQGLFFSGAAVVTFGGAYAVLAYVAQQAVNVYGWLAPGEMVRGLALAETTPGPLIMVVQFVAFVGAYRDPGSLDPWVAAVLASLLSTWVTFVPCFLFVLLGAPYVERLRHNQHLTAALTGITAAVVGVIANLASTSPCTPCSRPPPGRVRPGQPRAPRVASWNPVAFALTVLALALMLWRKWSPLRTLGVCALLAAIGIVGLL